MDLVEGVNGIGHFEFKKEDIVRNKILIDIRVSGEINWYISHPHNFYLNTIIETGFFSLIAFGITTLPLFLFYPNWIPDFINNHMLNPAWAHPSSLIILRFFSFLC